MEQGNKAVRWYGVGVQYMQGFCHTLLDSIKNEPEPSASPESTVPKLRVITGYEYLYESHTVGSPPVW